MEQPCCCPRCDDCVELHDMRECDECRMLMCESCVKPMGCDYLCERCRQVPPGWGKRAGWGDQT